MPHKTTNGPLSVEPFPLPKKMSRVGKHGHGILGLTVNGTSPASYLAARMADGRQHTIDLKALAEEVREENTPQQAPHPKQAPTVEQSLRAKIVAVILWLSMHTANNL